MIKIQIDGLATVENILSALEPRIVRAADFAGDQIALAVQTQARHNAYTGKHDRGEWHIEGTGPGPNVMTGHLRESITVLKKGRKGLGRYETVVTPTMAYARAVELGGFNWRGEPWKRVQEGLGGYPYMGPAADQVRPQAHRIFITNFKIGLSR